MAINLQALDMFRTATDWTGKGIANLDGDDAIKQNGTYGGPLGALRRSKIEQAANNEVRTELLRALGTAFGLSGMSEENGKVKFSKDFMDRLESLIGADFKRDDFKIDHEGNVTSGRPLTARRIKAILTRAETAATEMSGTSPTEKTEKTGKAAKLTKLGGVRKEKTYGPYAEKLATIKHEIAKLDKGDDSHVFSFFNRVGKTLGFLYDELDVDRVNDEAPDPSALRNDQEYEWKKELGELNEGEKPSFEYFDDKQGKYVKFESSYSYQNGLLWNKVGGGLLHLERSSFRTNESDDIAPLRKYIVDNLRLFVMKSIDVYFAAKEAGKLDLFFEHLREPGACLEDQCLHLVEFEAKHLSDGLQGLSSSEVDELERIAKQDPAKLATPDVDRQIGDIYDEIGNEQWFLDKEEFDDDIAKILIERLQGKTCAITKYNTSTHKFEPLLEKGKPVVRPLTAEDIRTFGALIFKETFM
ncbi:MAG: hypothetical protein IJR99_15030 [Kiritimatiellae bacterium]|nr:hypothetical protein [Kiritimatiellia bacterium]